MIKKILVLALFLVFIHALPVLANVNLEWDSSVGGKKRQDDTDRFTWDTGLIIMGNWSLGSQFTFLVKEQVNIDQAEQGWQSNLNRAYLQYEKEKVRLDIGRQGVAWGIGWFFRPTDLITPLTPLAKEETRPGKNLAVSRWSTSALTAVDLLAGDQVYAARFEWRFSQTNLRLLGVCQPDYLNAIGYDFQGGMGGLYGEGVYRWADNVHHQPGKFVGLLGVKKVLRLGSQLYVEYYRNDLTNAGFELDNRLFIQNKNNEVIYKGQNYLAMGMVIPVDQLTKMTLAAIANLDDKGAILEGNVDLQLTNSLELEATLMTVVGPEGTEFCPARQGYRIGGAVKLKFFF